MHLVENTNEMQSNLRGCGHLGNAMLVKQKMIYLNDRTVLDFRIIFNITAENCWPKVGAFEVFKLE